MGTGASRIDVEIVREALEILGVSGSGKAYLEAGMSDQNSNLAQNDHVEFTQQRSVDASGRIALSAGAGQLAGLFTLAAGGVYLCVAYIATTHSAAGTATFHWRDNTAAAFIGSQGGTFTAGAGNGPRAFCAVIIAPAVETEIEVRQNSSPTNLTQIDGSGPQQETSVFVVEIG